MNLDESFGLLIKALIDIFTIFLRMKKLQWNHKNVVKWQTKKWLKRKQSHHKGKNQSYKLTFRQISNIFLNQISILLKYTFKTVILPTLNETIHSSNFNWNINLAFLSFPFASENWIYTFFY